MPHCTNCGREVGETHRYCGDCGSPLSDRIANEDQDDIPVIGVHREGFLSGRSIGYLFELLSEDRTLDRESPDHKQLERDVTAALTDFAVVGAHDDINLLRMVASQSSSTDAAIASTDNNGAEQQRELMWLGFIGLIDLYDRSLGTDWSDQFTKLIESLLEEFEQETS